MTKLWFLLAVAGCSKTEEPAPSAPPAPDPWAAAPPTAAPGSGEDPWSKPAPVEPDRPAEAEPAPRLAPPSLAGSFQCQQMRYNTATRMSSYVSSALGVFEVDGDGTYRSASYPGKGTGRVRTSGTDVRFEGGAYAGSVGLAGTTQSGSFYIRFSGNLTDAPAAGMQFNDHMCYRK